MLTTPICDAIIGYLYSRYGSAALVFALTFSLGLICIFKRNKYVNLGMSQKPGYSITPLTNFEWKLQKPLQLRPYKPKFFLTMGITGRPPYKPVLIRQGIERMDASDLLKIDWDHFDRLEQRKSILDSTDHQAIFTSSSAEVAVLEMYEWLTHKYLCQRFPTIFKMNKSARHVENVVNGDIFPVKSPDRSADALRLLGRMVDEDMMFLLPTEEGDSYSLQAYVVCFTSGFDIIKIQGKKLRDVHTEVPGYKAKLQLSMERFLGKLEPGKYVQRANWTVIMDDRLRVTRGANHVYDDSYEEVPLGKDMSKARLRCERQVLHRLPQSGAIVFTFKTYLYPLGVIKAEGSGRALAEAIDGLQNIDGMPRYRGSLSWGAAVQHYLRS